MKFIYGLILGMIIIYYLVEMRNKCVIGYGKDAIMAQVIKKLVRQAARWTTAAKQDKNSLIAILHANYGTGYLWALKDIATTTQIKAATGIDMLKFENEILTIQDKATLDMAKLCPNFAPEKSYLTLIGGENVQ